MEMARDATIKDIAKAAGVSVATVSRVINDNYPVSDEAREKVRHFMEKLNYRPNAIAQSLRSNRSNMIGFIVADLSNEFFMQAAKGLEKVIAGQGYSLVVASSDGSAEKERQLIGALASKRIDGLCVASVDSAPETLRQTICDGTPVVLIDRMLQDVETSQVLWNDADSARTLTQMLIDNGHRDIGIVNVTLSHSAGQNRLAGFLSAMEQAAIPVPKSFISPSNFSSDEAYRFAFKLLSAKRRPTALLCANNVMAEGTLKAMQELGLKVDDDISLVCFGKIEWNKYLSPKITTIELDSWNMGERAGAILIDMIRSGKGLATQVVLPGNLILGGSVRNIS